VSHCSANILIESFFEGCVDYALNIWEDQKDNDKGSRTFVSRKRAEIYGIRIARLLLSEMPSPEPTRTLPERAGHSGRTLKEWKPGHGFTIRVQHDCNRCGYAMMPGDMAHRVYAEHICGECYQELLEEYNGDLERL
jgi:hypothetical protein